ncbi:MAG: radical SAM family heme chaperone HemW [Planctomycetota bacterium]|nr:MAG: radical SAM family heme chaperone HemW [Planctomycetota bacterium]
MQSTKTSEPIRLKDALLRSRCGAGAVGIGFTPQTVRSAYVHVPFCRHRCGYCDFALVAGRGDLVEAYLEGVAAELAELPWSFELDTLYVGGGTPTFLSPGQLRRLFALLTDRLALRRGAEVTIEANPADLLDARKRAALADLPVTRISLGVQSLDPAVLKTLERDHRPAEIHEVFAALRAARSDWQLACDLIFAVPGQTIASWQNTLQGVIALQPDHVSAYGLTFEKGTAFWSRRRRGVLTELPEDEQLRMYDVAIDRLTAAGFEHYEISNLARPGCRSRHNLAYWTFQPYLAFGPGAAWFVGGVRGTNHRSVFTWLKRVHAGVSPVAEFEILDAEQQARDRLWLGLRLREGVELETFRQETGFCVDELLGARLREHVQQGRLTVCDGRLMLTREGLHVADSVFADCVG